MPNFSRHFVTGAAVGGGANLAWQVYVLHTSPEPPRGFAETVRRIDFVKVALFSIGGGIVASIPDLLEPATSPNHRGIFHSLLCGLAVFYVAFGKPSANLSLPNQFSLRAVALSYLSHLFLDSLTPKSLPLVGLPAIAI